MGHNKKNNKRPESISLQKNIGESSTNIFQEPNINFLESKIRFSFRMCDTKKFCIRKLTDIEIVDFYSVLKKYEEMTWREISQCSHKIGLTYEKKEWDSYKDMSRDYPNINNFMHFRVKNNSLFRIYGSRDKDLFLIIKIDPKGKFTTHG